VGEIRSYSSLGGCHPTNIQRCRATSRCGRLRFIATTVTRPMAVIPCMKRPSSLQRKCFRQCCVRGLYRGIVSPCSRSIASICAPLCPLHSRHERQRFARSVVPPRAIGRICSILSRLPEICSSLRQYPHRWPASYGQSGHKMPDNNRDGTLAFKAGTNKSSSGQDSGCVEEEPLRLGVQRPRFRSGQNRCTAPAILQCPLKSTADGGNRYSNDCLPYQLPQYHQAHHDLPS
jgi:hypothetical protein